MNWADVAGWAWKSAQPLLVLLVGWLIKLLREKVGPDEVKAAIEPITKEIALLNQAIKEAREKDSRNYTPEVIDFKFRLQQQDIDSVKQDVTEIKSDLKDLKHSVNELPNEITDRIIKYFGKG